MIKLAQELIQLQSESNFSDNREIIGYVESFIKEIGLKPIKQKIQDNLYNLVVVGTGNLLINGHLDTVSIGDGWTKKQGEILDGKLYGRGSSDTKGNVACVLAALRDNPNENITFTFTGVEEWSFLGIETIMKLRKNELKNISYGITLEPTGGKLCCLSKGVVGFEVVSKGKSAHGSTPELGENAIEKLANLILKLDNYKKKLAKKCYKTLGSPTINIGTISGGTGPNVVPDLARMTVDRRILPNETVDQVIAEFMEFCKGFDVNLVVTISPSETDENSRLITLFKDLTGEKEAHPSLGANETSCFVKSGIEGLTYGPGRGDQAHKINEFIEIREMEKSRKVFDKLFKITEDVHQGRHF